MHARWYLGPQAQSTGIRVEFAELPLGRLEGNIEAAFFRSSLRTGDGTFQTPSERSLNLNRQTLPPRTMHSSWMTSLPMTSDIMARSK